MYIKIRSSQKTFLGLGGGGLLTTLYTMFIKHVLSYSERIRKKIKNKIAKARIITDLLINFSVVPEYLREKIPNRSDTISKYNIRDISQYYISEC